MSQDRFQLGIRKITNEKTRHGEEEKAGAPENVEGMAPGEVCEYIKDLSLELRVLAQDAKFDFLAHLLEMVFLECLHLSEKSKK